MKKLEYIVPGLMLAGFVMFMIFGADRVSLGAGGPFNNVKQYLTVNATPYMNHSTASTTQTNLVYVHTATTSYAFATDSSDQVNFNLLGAMATSTQLDPFATTGDVPTSNSVLSLAHCYYYSDDEVNWFAPPSNCDYWTPQSTATTTKNVAVTSVNSKFMKIEFRSPNATSTRFGLWAQGIIKKGY